MWKYSDSIGNISRHGLGCRFTYHRRDNYSPWTALGLLSLRSRSALSEPCFSSDMHLQMSFSYKCTYFIFWNVHLHSGFGHQYTLLCTKMQRPIWYFISINWTGTFLLYWHGNSFAIWYRTLLSQKKPLLCNRICNSTANNIALSIRDCEWDWNGHWADLMCE